MEHVRCNLCGSDQYGVVFAAGRAQPNQIVRCTQCGLMYGNPRLTEIDVVRVGRYDPDFLPGMLARDYDPRMDKESYQVIDWDDSKTYLAQRFPKRGELLEIGCGLGFLSRHFQRDGWHVTGIEPDPLCARHAKDVLGVPVVPKILPEAQLPDASQDAVVMSHVIEHVPDPAQTLSEVHRILRPGGVLVMETPRYDSLAFRLLGRHERSIACDGHIYFFTTKTLAALADKAGFRVLRHDIVGRSLTIDRLLWNLGVMLKSPRFKDMMASLSKRLSLTRLRIKLNARDMQRITLVKAA